ncbi:MAG: biotin/lipoyl-binding protein [Thermoanaerobaculales bacterium]|jgi:biotin carboxyl carrier protein|nr:biotin/lipoyl-binding protein [Thermoanaerobaculales bacterium]
MSDYVLRIGDREYRARVTEMTADRAVIVVDDASYEVGLVEIGRPARPAPARAQRAPVRTAVAAAPPPGRSAARPADEAPGAVRAPLPGLVLRLAVKAGDTVQAGQPLLVMEAMKMENVVPAPHRGTIRAVFVAEGDTVGEGDPLVEVARPEMTTL